MTSCWHTRAGELVKVPAPYTSQTCCRCGYVDKRNRTSQARFRCVACGFAVNADHNAAINILGRYGASMPARPPARG
ncbi:MAG: transposase [Acidobacteria bacterium]|nr:transposase [Acidobacteriota bacterium]